MSQYISTNNLPLYAECFSRIGITGNRWLSFRDVPELIQKYVRGTRTLDYGCGTAWSTLFLKSLKLEVDGVDINQDMIRLAKEKDPQGQYTIIASGKILAEDASYDLVFSSWVLPYISSKCELLNIVTDIARVLKKGGIVIAVGTSKYTFKYKWHSMSAEFPENENLFSGSSATLKWKDNGLFMRFYYWTEEDYKEILSNAGLKLICIHRPLGHASDGYDWISETEKNSCDIYVATK